MKRVLDTNVWLALVLTEHPGHQVAQDWFKRLKQEPKSLLFCRFTEQSVLRLLTSEKVLRNLNLEAFTNDEAVETLIGMQRNPTVGTETEAPSTKKLWLKLAARPSASPQLWIDAYLAAFAISGHHQMVTFDKGFRQFNAEGLKLKLLTRPPG